MKVEDVACPSCGAVEGKNCFAPGKLIRAHKERWDVYRKLPVSLNKHEHTITMVRFFAPKKPASDPLAFNRPGYNRAFGRSSYRCKKGDHSRCTMMNCTCGCHGMKAA